MKITDNLVCLKHLFLHMKIRFFFKSEAKAWIHLFRIFQNFHQKNLFSNTATTMNIYRIFSFKSENLSSSTVTNISFRDTFCNVAVDYELVAFWRYFIKSTNTIVYSTWSSYLEYLPVPTSTNSSIVQHYPFWRNFITSTSPVLASTIPSTRPPIMEVFHYQYQHSWKKAGSQDPGSFDFFGQN